MIEPWVATKVANGFHEYEIHTVSGNLVALVPPYASCPEIASQLIASIPDMCALIDSLAEAQVDNPSPALKAFIEEAQKIRMKTRVLARMT